MNRTGRRFLSLSFAVGLLWLASTAAAVAQDDCGGLGEAVCANHQCAQGLTLGADQKCRTTLSPAQGQQVSTSGTASDPNYQIVCVSAQRLGDCGQWFTVSDSTTISGSGYLWILYSAYNGVCPTGGSTQPPQNPLYSTVCVSNERLGDCGQWFNVVGTSTGSIGGQNYLWLLYKSYNGTCP